MRLRLRSLLTRESAKQAILAMAATTIPNVFHFAYHVAMTRQLGVELYGALSSLFSLLIISSIRRGSGDGHR